MALEHVDVLIVGAGLSGIGAGYHLQANCPGKTLRDPRGAGLRSAGRGTCSATRASARTRTCTRSATPSGRGTRPRRSPTGRRSSTTSRRPRASTASTRRSASATAWCAPSGRRADARWTVDGGAQRHRRDACTMTLRLPAHVQRLLPLRRGLHAGLHGHGALRRADRPPAALDRGPRLRRQARRGDRQRRDRGHARPRDGAQRGARDDAAALAQLHRLAARRGPDRQASCAARCRRRLAYASSRWKNVLRTMAELPAQQAQAGAR